MGLLSIYIIFYIRHSDILLPNSLSLSLSHSHTCISLSLNLSIYFSASFSASFSTSTSISRLQEEGRALHYIYIGRIRVHGSKITGLEFGYMEGVEVTSVFFAQNIFLFEFYQVDCSFFFILMYLIQFSFLLIISLF